MARLFTLTIILLAALTASAAKNVAATPWRVVDGGWMSAVAHLRVLEAPGSAFGMRFSNNDSNAWREIRVDLPNSGIDDIFGITETRITYLTCDLSGLRTVDSTMRVPFTSHDSEPTKMSIKLTADRYGARIVIGRSTPFYTARISLDNEAPLLVSTFTTGKTKPVKFDVRSRQFERIDNSGFCSLDSLEAYVAQSADPSEGLWKFYDRSFAPLHVADAGRYRIATVRSLSGDYDIIFLGSDDDVATRLKPFQIKGRLQNSGFENIFNLDWRDADGTPVGWHASATIEGDLLTLRFPYWNIVLRFARTS